MSAKRNINIADLFCGMGGLTIGAIEAIKDFGANPNIKFACDIDPGAASFYKLNFSDFISEFHAGDISEMLSEDFHAELSDVERNFDFSSGGLDYLFAGPPCQGHSNLNNHSRRNDPRNFLYLRTIRFIQVARPKYFMIENVPSVIHSQENVVAKSIRLLEGFGYSVRELVVDFLRLGIPQSRKRHVVVGCLDDDIDRISAGIYTEERRSLADVLGDLLDAPQVGMFDTPSKMTADNLNRVRYLFDTESYDLPNELRPPCHQGKHSYKSMYGRLEWNGVAQTLTSGFGSMGQGRYVHPLRKRVITPHEAARIQGLPDWLNYSEVKMRSNLQKMIGNAVPPALSNRFVKSTLG
ncbi:DNA cytosine methyltransferase [Pseudomonas sichuanensis]|uniref:DNA cytosine methyltransferase n=1 Tax=Pseudomonas sichuanensis TaxID=2213015 RepID=UPI002B40622C|nr:DNA cytosine methyltransferase [Pseudomonas sichuanensis]